MPLGKRSSAPGCAGSGSLARSGGHGVERKKRNRSRAFLGQAGIGNARFRGEALQADASEQSVLSGIGVHQARSGRLLLSRGEVSSAFSQGPAIGLAALPGRNQGASLLSEKYAG